MPRFSSCRGSRTCDGAATRWCWNRRAPARCSGFAIRRSRPPWRSLSTPQQVGQTPPAGWFSRDRASRPAGGLPDPFQGRCRRRRRPPARRGRHDLVLWDFHDLLFHARSTQGRHANPLGGHFPYAGVMPPLPAVRRRWPGKKIDLRKLSLADAGAVSPTARLLRERHSIRSFDDQRPITLVELSRFLDSTARVLSRWNSRIDLGDARPEVAYAATAVSVGGRRLRARALSGGRQMRRACPRILSLRRRRTRAGADRRPHAGTRSAVDRSPDSPWASPLRRRS